MEIHICNLVMMEYFCAFLGIVKLSQTEEAVCSILYTYAGQSVLHYSDFLLNRSIDMFFCFLSFFCRVILLQPVLLVFLYLQLLNLFLEFLSYDFQGLYTVGADMLLMRSICYAQSTRDKCFPLYSSDACYNRTRNMTLYTFLIITTRDPLTAVPNGIYDSSSYLSLLI